MYLHICKNIIIKKENIIGIFDIETIKDTKEYNNIYNNLIENNNIIDISDNIRKSLILTKENGIYKGYISNISVTTLEKRAK